MYVLAAIPFVLALFWLLVFVFRLLSVRAARRSRESQVAFWAGLCEFYAQRAASAPRLSEEWVRCKLDAERMAMKAFSVLSSRRSPALDASLSSGEGRAAQRPVICPGLPL